MTHILPQTQLRLWATATGVALAAAALWMLIPQLSRPALGHWPDPAAHDSAAAAAFAAAAGWPRGDLAVDAALAANADLLALPRLGAADAAALAARRAEAESAALAAPADARIWLALAALNDRSAAGQQRAAALLKMSYYTSSGDPRLSGRRVALATQLDSLDDSELAVLLDGEIAHIAGRRPPAIAPLADAYRSASPAGRRVLEAAVSRVDPGLLPGLSGR